MNENEAPKMALTSETCPRCKQRVISAGQFCPNCGMILDLKAEVRLEDERAKADQIMDLLMRDDEVRMLLVRKISGLVSSETLPSS